MLIAKHKGKITTEFTLQWDDRDLTVSGTKQVEGRLDEYESFDLVGKDESEFLENVWRGWAWFTRRSRQEGCIFDAEWKSQLPGFYSMFYASIQYPWFCLNAMTVWRWEDAPKRFQCLSFSGGDEDWVIWIPEMFKEDIEYLSCFRQNYSAYDWHPIPLNGGYVVILAH